MHIIVIGPSCSGKTTILSLLAEAGHTVYLEPENEIFPQFLKDPKAHAFANQSNLMKKLIDQEATEHADDQTQYFESGVLATEVYNRYLHDKGLLTDDEFHALDQMYAEYTKTHTSPDLVAFLSATPDQLKERAMSRDGAVAMDPDELRLYWDKLLQEVQQKGIGVLRLNTGFYAPPDAVRMLLQEVDVQRKKETPQVS